MKRLTTEEFIEKARAKHGDKYNYSQFVYEHSQVKGIIICPEHGAFLQTPASHLSGQGCPACNGIKLKSTDQFIAEARAKHDDKYDYSLVDYANNYTKVKIICPEHGVFEQRPDSHLSGSDCPACAKSGYDPSKPGILYYVMFDLPGLTLWKIGITNLTVRRRFAGFKIKPTRMWVEPYPNGTDAYEREQEILKSPLYAPYKYTGEAVIESGYTECFTKNILPYGSGKFETSIAA